MTHSLHANESESYTAGTAVELLLPGVQVLRMDGKGQVLLVQKLEWKQTAYGRTRPTAVRCPLARSVKAMTMLMTTTMSVHCV